MATLSDAAWYAILFAGVGVSLFVLYSLARPGGNWGRTVRSRLLLGVPWGTLIGVSLVAAFYLFVQDGLTAPTRPVHIPFRAWSYFYPIGVLTSGIAHSGLGHVTGNLLSALVFGSLAEYAWSHFPRQRGASTFSSPLTNPFARIGAFVAGIFLVSIFTSIFGLGPVIGFSGVVFAFVGFSLVRFPLATIVAVLFRSVVSLLYDALRSPETAITVGETTVGSPWWAGIAIQGHAIGLFVGVVLGVGLLYRRGVRPNPGHVWLAALVFAVDRGLWAIYLIEGSGSYRLFRALGVAAVFLIAAIVVASAVSSDRTLVERIDLSRREAAFGLVLSTLLVLSFIAVPFNLFVVDDPTAGIEDSEAIEIEDYTVFYAEDVPNQYVPAVPLPGAEDDGGTVNASGIVVVSEARNIWWEEVSTTRLRVQGAATIRLGGLDWSEDVRVNRTTWAITGGNTTYNVLFDTGTDRSVAYRAEPAEGDVRIDGRGITIAPVDDGFEVWVTRNGETVATAPVPKADEEVTAGGVHFERDEAVLVASRGDTHVRVAQKAS